MLPDRRACRSSGREANRAAPSPVPDGFFSDRADQPSKWTAPPESHPLNQNRILSDCLPASEPTRPVRVTTQRTIRKRFFSCLSDRQTTAAYEYDYTRTGQYRERSCRSKGIFACSGHANIAVLDHGHDRSDAVLRARRPTVPATASKISGNKQDRRPRSGARGPEPARAGREARRSVPPPPGRILVELLLSFRLEWRVLLGAQIACHVPAEIEPRREPPWQALPRLCSVRLPSLR